MPQSVLPFLMFQGNGPEAIDFYRTLFPNATLDVVDRHDPVDGQVDGAAKRGSLTIAGQTVLFFDSPPVHDFSFTPSFSLFVTCDSQDELRHLAHQLAADGTTLMPPDAYGFSTLFAWVNDRFGVSWQLSYG